jgi:hypothetical protein
MKELHVSTEIKGKSALEIITRIAAELWHEKEDTCQRVIGYTEECALTNVDELHEKTYAEGIMAGLDIAMDIITGVILPNYFGCDLSEIPEED